MGIYEGAFKGCSDLASITVDSENTAYDSRDNCNAIIEKTTNTLIAGCQNTVIPNSVTSIGYGAFSYCSGLTSIIIPNSVTETHSEVFYNCSNLTSITIGNSVTKIGEKTFSGCSSLTSITIPNSVTSIGNCAFDECSSLTSVTILNPSPISIFKWVFSNRANATLYVPQGSKEAYQAAVGWKEFKEIVEIDITGIEQIQSNEKNNATTIFTLDGKRVNKSQKGINIINGRKVLMK